MATTVAARHLAATNVTLVWAASVEALAAEVAKLGQTSLTGAVLQALRASRAALLRQRNAGPKLEQVILYSSAIVAIFLNELEAKEFLSAIAHATDVGVSAATFVEAGIVLSHRLNKPVQDDMEFLFNKLGVEVLAFTNDHRQEALQAWWRFGKTRHRAARNLRVTNLAVA